MADLPKPEKDRRGEKAYRRMSAQEACAGGVQVNARGESDPQLLAEGAARVDKGDVFLNRERVQRDVTVMAVRAYATMQAAPRRDLVFFDAMAASGLRGLRVALECEHCR